MYNHNFISLLLYSSPPVLLLLCWGLDFFFFLVGSVNSFNGRSPEKKKETAVVAVHLSNASYNNNK